MFVGTGISAQRRPTWAGTAGPTERPHCWEEPLDADLRHRECSEREALLTVLACLSGMWCGILVTQIEFKIVLKKSSFSSARLPDRVGCQFVQFSSGNACQVPPFSSLSSVYSIQFTNSSGPGEKVINGINGGHGSPPSVNTFMCIPAYFKNDIFTD